MKRKITTCAVAALAGSAAADSIDLTFTGRGLGWGNKITLDGVSTNNVFTGELMHSFTNGTGGMSALNGLTLATYSVEFEQPRSWLGSCYDVVDPATLPVGDGMGDARAWAIDSVFAYAGTIGTTDVNDARSLAAATQMVIWEIIYDFDPTVRGGGLGTIDITSGHLSATQTRNDHPLSNTIMRHFNTLRDYGIGYGARGSTIGLGSPGFQDQVAAVAVVPLPSAACAGFVSLGLLAARRRR